jgi:hypothetical protein
MAFEKLILSRHRRAHPGVSYCADVIPGKVGCTLELRDLDDAKIDTMFNRIRDESNKIGDQNGTQFAFSEELHAAVPAPSDLLMRSIISDAAKSLDLSMRDMPSGAGHDAQAMAQLGPMGMIFIASIGRISRSPKEFSRPQDINERGEGLAPRGAHGRSVTDVIHSRRLCPNVLRQAAKSTVLRHLLLFHTMLRNRC